MSESIVQKLVSLLGFKLTDTGILKRYDKTIADSQKKYEKGFIKAQEKVLISEAKVNNVRQTLAAKLAGQKAIIEGKVAEKAVISGHRINQAEQATANRSVVISSSTARTKIKISESSDAAQWRSFKKYGDMAEREMNRRLAAQKRAAQKAKTDMDKDIHGLGMVAGMGSMFFGHQIKKDATTFGDFQQAMIRVKTKTAATPEEIEKLTKQALHLGRTTQFDPLEVANLIGEGAGQGYSIADIQRLIPNVLNLSTITGKDPTESMRMMSETLHQFGIQAKDSEGVADVLGISIGRLGVKAENMGFTMKYAGQLSKEMGIDLKHAAALAILQSRAGIVGSTSGTSLRRALSNISSKESSIAILDKLKIQRFNDNDNMDIFRILGELDKKTKKMKKGDRAAVFKGLFEQTAFAPMMGLSRQIGSGGGQQILNTLGTLSSKKMATDMFKGFNAEMKKTHASLMTLDKVLGEKLAPKLEYFAAKIRMGADALSAADPKVLQLIADFAIAGFGVTAFLATFIGTKFVVGQLAPLVGIFKAITAAVDLGTISMWGFNASFYVWFAIPALIAFIGYEIYQTVTKGKSLFVDFANVVSTLFKTLFGIDIPASFDVMVERLSGGVQKLKDMFSDLANTLSLNMNFGAPNINPGAQFQTPQQMKLDIKHQVEVVSQHAKSSKTQTFNFGPSHGTKMTLNNASVIHH